MWIQCTLSRDDFARVLNSLLPLRIQLDPGSETSGVIYLSKPKHVSLVPQRGVRLRVRGRIRWPVLGVSVPVTLREVQLVLEPHIVGRGRQQRLAFIPVVEQADVNVVPGFVERWLIPKLNKQLASPQSEFAWKFIHTLHLDFPLPAQLDPVHKMGLRANWGAVRVTREAMTLALSLRLKVTREKVRPLDAPAPLSEPEPAPGPTSLPDPRDDATIAREPPLVPVEGSRPDLIDERSHEPPPRLSRDPALLDPLPADDVLSPDLAEPSPPDSLVAEEPDEISVPPVVIGPISSPSSFSSPAEPLPLPEPPPFPPRPTVAEVLASVGALPPLAVEPPPAPASSPSPEPTAADLLVRFAAPPEIALGVVPPIPAPGLPPELAAAVQASTPPPAGESGPIEDEEAVPTSRVALAGPRGKPPGTLLPS